MPVERVGWGLVGSTSWADRTFGPAVQEARNAELRGVVSSDADKARAFANRHGIKGAFPRLDDMLADPGIAAVWIASPNHLHREHTLAALRAGKHVLVEKPMAVSSRECRDMIAAAEQSDRLLSIGYHARHHPAHQELHRLWQAGNFGAPVHVRAHLYSARSDPPAEWRRRRATSGGFAMADIGTHLVDLLRWFLGDPDEVTGALGSPRFGLETEDHAFVLARFPGGAVGTIEAASGTPGPGFSLELYGTGSYAICRDTFFGSAGTLVQGQGSDEPTVRSTEPVNPYQRQVDAFCAAIMREQPLAVSAEDGLRNVMIMEQARGY